MSKLSPILLPCSDSLSMSSLASLCVNDNVPSTPINVVIVPIIIPIGFKFISEFHKRCAIVARLTAPVSNVIADVKPDINFVTIPTISYVFIAVKKPTRIGSIVSIC